MDSGSSADGEGQVDHFKITVVGNGAVGKTSLLRHFHDQAFNPSYTQTIGLDFYSRKIEIPGTHGREAVLQIWDIGGQQLGGTMIKNYLYNADAICFVYDVTNSSSFKDVDDWLNTAIEIIADTAAEQVASTGIRTRAQPVMMLVGNKTDLPDRQVTVQQHEKYAKERGMRPYLVSARSGENVNSLFGRMAADLCGVQVHQQDLEYQDRVTAHVESRPSERAAAPRTAPTLSSTEQKKKKRFF